MGIRGVLDARMMVLGPLAMANGLGPTMEDYVRAFSRGFARSGDQMVQVVPDARLLEFLSGQSSSGIVLTRAA